MLVLLVIFMVAAPMMTTGSGRPADDRQKPQVPGQPDPGDGQCPTFRFQVKDDKGRDSGVDKAGLAAYLRAEQAKEPELAVLVAGDRNARYETVLDVLDSVGA